PPDETPQQGDPKVEKPNAPPVAQQPVSDSPTPPLPLTSVQESSLQESGDAGTYAPSLPPEAAEILPTVPSLENANLGAAGLNATGLNVPSIVSLDEVKNAVGELSPSTDLLAPLDAMMKGSSAPVSEQLSHSFFESMKLRLKTVTHLNQAAAGLVDEAAILYQRGDIAEAQKLLGLATQLRETTARLLVTHQ
ncbi:MAG: hypothetical protein SFV81_28545, partial [Pirellulaceae bacterium]|nr:hypothetical protein [Pirellulaceae bacterium]